MTEQEKINSETNLKLEVHDAKFNAIIEEIKQQRDDMRRLWEKQDADMRAMNEKRDADMKAMNEKRDADMKAMNEKRDADMKAMNEKIDANQKEFTQQLHSNFVQTMIGVGAIMAAIGGLIIATLK